MRHLLSDFCQLFKISYTISILEIESNLLGEQYNLGYEVIGHLNHSQAAFRRNVADSNSFGLGTKMGA